MMDSFNDYVKMEAICTYLKSFGYKAKVKNDDLTVDVQDPKWDTFVIVKITCWEAAREFIKVRTAQL
jgi:hypothetical protein